MSEKPLAELLFAMRVMSSGSNQISPEVAQIPVIVEKKEVLTLWTFRQKKFPYLSLGFAGNVVGHKSVLSYSLTGSGTAVEIVRMVARRVANSDVVCVNVISMKQVTGFQDVFPA
jgi:hypothetical protein